MGVLGVGLTDEVEIGRGGFGTVYRAVTTDGEIVAVKVLAAAQDRRQQARFAAECRAMRTLSGHPNIATVHSWGRTRDGRRYHNRVPTRRLVGRQVAS